MDEWEKRLEASEAFTSKDCDLLKKFAYHCMHKPQPVGLKRLEKYRTDLVIASSMAGMSLEAMLKNFKSLEKAANAIKDHKAPSGKGNKPYSLLTKMDALRTLGSIYHFKHHNEASLQYAPRELKELLTIRKSAKDKRLPKEVITREEMREMLKYGDTLDKAIISLLFDSGERIGEFEQHKRSDIRHISEGLDVLVPAGKTGERKIVVVEATKYVLDWMEQHRVKKEDAPLWLSPDTGRPLKQAAIAKRIRNVVERLNQHRKEQGLPFFNKPINPHNFRHSRASELGAQLGMTEPILCKYFGWEIGSDMPHTYLHLNDEQIKRAVLATHGKAKLEDTKVITHWTCRKCQYENPLANENCGKCTTPKDSDKEIVRVAQLEQEIERLRKKQDVYQKVVVNIQALQNMMLKKNPELKKELDDLGVEVNPIDTSKTEERLKSKKEG